MVVIHVIDGRIYAIRHCDIGCRMERIELQEAIKLITEASK